MSEQVQDVADHANGRADADTFVERGMEASEANELELALSNAQAALEQEPKHFQALMLKARALASLGRIDEAFRFLRDVTGDTADPKALRFARTFAQEQGRPDEALDHAFRLMELGPHDEMNRAFVGQEFLNLDAPESALAQSEQMIADGSAKLGPMIKAQALAKLDRRGEGMDILRECLRGQGDDPKLLRMARTFALEDGHPYEASEYARRLQRHEPGHVGNHIALVQCCLAAGEFQEALDYADQLIDQHSHEIDGHLLRAQALVALHRVGEAMQSLEDALQDQPGSAKLLRTGRTIAFQNGAFDTTIQYSLRLLDLHPDEEATHIFLVQSYLALGRTEEAKAHLERHGKDFRLLGKTGFHLRHSRKVEETAPAFVKAWRAALDNTRLGQITLDQNPQAVMIQYWSQGTLPQDVALVHASWRDLFDREKLGKVELFDHDSAASWIKAHAPDFAPVFAESFHYAMESDIFRIAYASKRQCIYMDIDSWPLNDAAHILRFALQARRTMLYSRSYRPWLVNGSFVSAPDSVFISELVRQTLAIRLEDFPKNHETIEHSFGPTRYNKVLLDLLEGHEGANVGMANAPGCSFIDLGAEKLYLTHEAALASVKPPFPLGYKATEDYWKWVSIPA